MRVRNLRLPTAVAVVLCCGWTAIQGADIVRFQIASLSVAGANGRGEALGAWSGTPGLALLALQGASRALPEPAGRGELLDRQQRLSAELAIRPTAPGSWVALAELRSALQMPDARIDAAFGMSALTGPNEGAAMYQRSLFGVLHWERSSPALRKRAMTDLCGLTNFDTAKFRIVLAIKTDAIRADIRDSMSANGCNARKFELVGLQP